MSNLLTTTKPGKKYRSIKNPRVYEALRRQGMSKERAARISNAQKRHKAFTLGQLEAFVSSDHYDATTASLIASRIPLLPSLKGEQIAPGITRIHGNLCNVHGKYGPCDKALSGKKKPGKGRARKPAKPKKTGAQRATERDQKRQQNVADVAKRMADSDTGLAPAGSKALVAFAQGKQPTDMEGQGLAKMGLAERAQDGSYRMTPTGRAVVSAMQAGDYQRAVDAVSRGADAQAAREGRATARTARQTAAAGKRQSAAIGRELAKREREQAARKRDAERAAKKPVKASAGGSKKPDKQAAEKPLRARPAKRVARSSAPSVGSSGSSSSSPKKPAPKPEKAPAKQIAPELQDAAQSLSDGEELSDDDAQALIRNGLARLVKGELVLTAAGQRATMKELRAQDQRHTPYGDAEYDPPEQHPIKDVPKEFHIASIPPSFKVFKDVTGAYRWVAQSSTAFQDRDREIVSTKALAEDCDYADQHGAYGPLRWWHTPGLDLGDCDFNAMHGRVLIESGTFRSATIAQKVARAAAGLEISLGFLHLPTEPDADGVFHHIRRFERSLVPRGKASNRFTAFTVKESVPMFDKTKVAALKQLGFSDDDIAGLQQQAEATEKSATDQGVAFKAEEPAELPDLVINGVTYKAFKPVEEAAAPVEEDKALPGNAEEDAMDGGADDDMETDADPNALTLSTGDLGAINEMIVAAVGQIMGGLDLEKKVAGHVQGLLAPFQQQQATKDAESSTYKEAVNELQLSVLDVQKRLAELTGDQPAAPYRPSQASNNTLKTDVELAAAVKSAIKPGAGQFDDIIQGLGLAPRNA